MAKFTIEFDTLEKKLTVSLDGTPVENVIEVCAGRYYGSGDYGEPGIMITTKTEDEQTDITLMTRLMAEKNVKVQTENSKKAIEDIQRYFNKC